MVERRRRYSEQTLKRLWALSGNQCYMTGCTERLAYPNKSAVMGRIAHIRGWSPNGPRPAEDLSDKELCSFDNLLLLCPTHHVMVDEIDVADWTVTRLEDLKRNHEDERHQSRLDGHALVWVVEFSLVHLVGGGEQGDEEDDDYDGWPTLAYDGDSGFPSSASIQAGLRLLVEDPSRALIWAAYAFQEMEPAIRGALPDDRAIDTTLEEMELYREDDGYGFLYRLLSLAREHEVISGSVFEDADWLLEEAFYAGAGNPPDVKDVDRAGEVLDAFIGEAIQARSQLKPA